MKPIDRKRSPVLAIFYLAVGMLIVGIAILCVTLAPGMVNYSAVETATLLSIFIGGPIAYFLSKFAFNRFINKGRQMLAPTAAEVLSKNPINPVLYLRSFKIDEAPSDYIVSKNAIAIPKPTEEMRIGHSLNIIGPMVAIGDPEEELPKLGAARLYSTNETWKDRFYELLDSCKHVLWTVGVTPSVLWEFSQISSDKIFRKAIIYVPHRKMNQAQREAFWADFRKHLSDNYPAIFISAPQTLGNTTFLVFDGQKNLVPIPSKKSLFSNPLDSGLKNLVKHLGASTERIRAAYLKSLLSFFAIILGSILFSSLLILATVNLANFVEELIFPLEPTTEYYEEDTTEPKAKSDPKVIQDNAVTKSKITEKEPDTETKPSVGQSDFQEEMAAYNAGEAVELPAQCINTDDLNIRAKPSLEGEVLSEIPYLANLTLLKRGPFATINGNQNYWILVEYDGVKGWVWGRWIKVGTE